MSKRIDGNVCYCDVDSTLVFDESDFEGGVSPDWAPTTVHCWGRNITVWRHYANIELFQKIYNRGYKMIVHSHSGSEWAEVVCKALGLDSMVTLYIDKPKFYIDDLPVEKWFGEKVYRPYK